MKKGIVFAVILSLCFSLVACAAFGEEREKPPIVWTTDYNIHYACGIQAMRMLPEGTTKRELTVEEIASVVPASLRSEMEITGDVYFLADKSLYYMALQMTQGENYASVILGNDISWGGCCMSVTFEGYADKTCSCGSVEYALFRKNQYPNGGMLLGHGEVNGVGLLVRMHGGNTDDIQPMFENILENFARYKAKNLSVASLKP